MSNFSTKFTGLLIAIIVLLLAGNVYFGYQSASLKKQLTVTTQSQELNTKVVNFTNLFIAKVLQVKDPVSFETRLQLENNIRDIKDDELLNQWNKFVASKSEVEAQTETKNLLQLLVSKIKTK